MKLIVSALDQLPNLADVDVLGVDIESTSFDDNTPAFNPFKGHRTCGYGFHTTDGQAWYLPLRHRPMGCSMAEAGNLPFEQTMRWIHELVARERTWVGHNLKFDARVMHFDGVTLKGTMDDTLVLARLVNQSLFSAKLSILSKMYLPEGEHKDDAEVKRYLKRIKSEDYGRVPVDILGPYCMQDVTATLALHKLFLEKLRPESKGVLQTERALTPILLQSELRGVCVPRIPLKRFMRGLLKNIEKADAELTRLTGRSVDVLSNPDLTATLSHLCVQPTEWTETGAASWTSDGLRGYGLRTTDLIADLKEFHSTYSNYGVGWLDRLAPDDTLHPNFKQTGAKTGRFASEDPNFQNLNPLAKKQVVPRDGYSFLSIDYSQIEFRLFAHYTESKPILDKYNNDPRTDFHQATADLLGLTRKSSKTFNFGMIYGMGKEKLERSLTEFIKAAIRKGDVALLERLRAFNYGEPVNEHNAHHVSAAVYCTFHRLFPEIKKFGYRVTDVCQQRRYVRNVYDRVYECPPNMDPRSFGFKARNYIVQGSAADLFKERMVALDPFLREFGAYLLVNVHDEVLLEVPTAELLPCARRIQPVLESPAAKLLVPIRVDISVCKEGTSWSDKISITEFAGAEWN